jgi:hypothetical protein
MKDFRLRGFHPRALAGGENDNVSVRHDVKVALAESPERTRLHRSSPIAA